MAAAVSSLVRVMNGEDSKESASAEKSTAPIITMDLLGGCCIHDSKELDLDFKSGKVYLERCNSSNSSSSNSGNNALSNETLSNFQDLDFHSSSKQIFEQSSLDLKLVTSSTLLPNYQSVCTLDKVKSALARAEEENLKKRLSSMFHSSLPPPSNSSSLIIDDGNNPDQEEKISASFAAGCPCCLLYVLISKTNPKCPRCSSDVPLPVAVKKPRIDLNMSI